MFNYIGENGGFYFKVIFLAETAKHMRWRVYKDQIRFNYEILPGYHYFIPRMEWTFHLNRGVFSLLKRENPEIIVGLGYDYLVTIFAFLYTKLKKKKFVLWSGSTLKSTRSKSRIIRFLKRMIIRNCDSYLSYGTEATNYLIAYGAKEDSIVSGWNTVDINQIILDSEKPEIKKEIAKLRRNYPSLNILFVGQLIFRKGLFTLIRAFEELEMNNVGLIILGEGSEREKYTNYCREKGIKNVFFEGFKHGIDVIKYYLLSDVFVLPSYREVWGLVVNEAMAYGLPIICSKEAGVATDLVKEEINGYTYDPWNVKELQEKLASLINNFDMRNRMGEESRRIIKEFTIENYGRHLLKAVSLALRT